MDVPDELENIGHWDLSHSSNFVKMQNNNTRNIGRVGMKWF
jgi:hypothetical protein